MFRAVRSVLPLALAAALTLAACGDDEGPATAAVPGKSYDQSEVCGLLPVETVAEILPGAKIDTALPTPYDCFYAADGGDVILHAASPDRVAEHMGEGPGTSKLPPGAMYEMALSDATMNGADDIREAPSIGEDGKIAINAEDAELTAAWRHGDEVYDIQFSAWNGSADEAVATVKQLAKAVHRLP